MQFNEECFKLSLISLLLFKKVEFVRPSLVRGVATQGRHLDPNTLCCVQRTTEYKVSYSNDGKTWTFLQNKNGNDIVRQLL